MKRRNSRVLKLVIAYDGTGYHGWQRQAGTSRTIQQVLEETLGRILQEKVTLVAASRTDAGVHALAQTAHFRTRSAFPCPRLRWAVNSLLPPEILVRRLEEAADGFHARFGAKGKRYRYRIRTGSLRPVFERAWVWHVRKPIDLAAMRRAARSLAGKRDFRAFCHQEAPARAAPAGRRARGTVRTLRRLSIRRAGREVHLVFEGDGFLHNMVRTIVGTLVEVGRGKRAAAGIPAILASRDRRKAGVTAPPQGLCLEKVRY